MDVTTDKEELLLEPFNESNDARASNAFSELLSLYMLVPLSGVYGIIFVTGILGNITTCIVIGYNRSIHTATNFYLFSLAISDLLLLIFGLPFEVHLLWNPFYYPHGESLCITVALILETSANATVLTITAFTVERYIAICHPFMSQKLSKLSFAVKLIITIWICALFAALPQVMQFGIVTYEKDEQTVSKCTVTGIGFQHVFVLSSFIFFIIPMSVIVVLYVLIGFKLYTYSILHPVVKSSSERGEGSHVNPRNKSGALQGRVIKMLIAVTLSFFFCWAPFHVQRLIAIYGKKIETSNDTYYQIYTFLTLSSGVLYFLSTAINPFLYNIMSNNFRKAFKVTLSSCCRCLGRSHLQRTYSSLLTELASVTSFNQSNLSIVYRKESESRFTKFTKKRLAGRTETVTSLVSSNSSVQEVDHEQVDEELGTYLYQVNCEIVRNTGDTSV